jgi:dUTP pyrophosphatase
MTLRIKLLTDTATAPTRGSPLSAGVDLYADIPFKSSGVQIPSGWRKLIPTGVAMALPPGCYGRVAPRSGLATKEGVNVLAGVVDGDYRGEVKVLLHNTGDSLVTITHGQRIAQLILEQCLIEPVEVVADLDETTRGASGFGSTGR